IRDCCGKKKGFITPDMPTLEAIFRIYLANGNQPMPLAHVGAVGGVVPGWRLPVAHAAAGDARAHRCPRPLLWPQGARGGGIAGPFLARLTCRCGVRRMGRLQDGAAVTSGEPVAGHGRLAIRGASWRAV